MELNATKTSRTIVSFNLPRADRATLDMMLPHVVAFVENGAAIPEDFADLIDVRLYEAEDGRRGVVTWAADAAEVR